MDAQLVAAIVLAAPIVLVAWGVGRMFWRMTVRNEPPEPGGSQGRQMVDRGRD